MFGNNMYNILLIAAVGMVIYVVLSKNNVLSVREKYEDNKSSSTVSTGASSEQSQKMHVKSAMKTAPKEYRNSHGASVNESTILNPNIKVDEMAPGAAYPGPFEGCYPKQKELKPEDLLPKDMNTKWAQVNPTGQGMLADRNFLDAGHHVGINTVGQTLRNANYSVRSEIPNPQIKVSPWQQSTIDPDVGRKPLEIGASW
jgi:hypothetical protein